MLDWGLAIIEVIGFACVLAVAARCLYEHLTWNERPSFRDASYTKYENYRRPAHCLPCPYKK